MENIPHAPGRVEQGQAWDWQILSRNPIALNLLSATWDEFMAPDLQIISGARFAEYNMVMHTENPLITQHTSE